MNHSPIRYAGFGQRQKKRAPASMIYKSVAIELAKVDDARGIVIADVNTLDVEDLQKDVVHSGAWAPLIADMKAGLTAWPSILLGHEWTQGVGTVIDADEVAGKLEITGQFLMKTQRGRDAFEEVKAGVYKNWSVGFMPSDDGHTYDDHGVHHVHKIGIWPEVSIVLVGASPGTRTLVTKGSAGLSQREYDYLLEEVMRRLDRTPVSASASDVIPRPSDQPFDFELDNPQTARFWEWNKDDNRYERRDMRQSEVPAPLQAGQDETMDEVTSRWMKGGFGLHQQRKA